jgi:hypothetical protein
MGGPDLRRVPAHHDHPRTDVTTESDRHDELRTIGDPPPERHRAIRHAPVQKPASRAPKINKNIDQNAS